jgi:hypothetical protein
LLSSPSSTPTDRYSLPSLSIKFHESSLSISIHATDVVDGALPADFKNVVKKANGSYSCSSLELMKLQRRFNDMVDEIFLLSDQLSPIALQPSRSRFRADVVFYRVIQELLADVIEEIGSSCSLFPLRS